MRRNLHRYCNILTTWYDDVISIPYRYVASYHQLPSSVIPSRKEPQRMTQYITKRMISSSTRRITSSAMWCCSYSFYHHQQQQQPIRLHRRLSSSTTVDENILLDISSSSPVTATSSIQSTDSTTTETELLLSNNEPKLQLWYHAIQYIPISIILPIGFGNTTDIANRTAFYGDKVLNYMISQILYQQQQQQYTDDNNNNITTSTTTNHSYNNEQQHIETFETNSDNGSNPISITDNISTTPTKTTTIIPDLGYISLLQSECMSNQLLSSLFHIIMKGYPHMTETILQLATQQQHDAGTMIEATVDAIMKYNIQNHNTDTNDTNSTIPTIDAMGAIQELAQYLVHVVVTEQRTSYYNAKGRLIELGGTVLSYRIDGTPDHIPKFRAIASYPKQQLSYISDPPSNNKKIAEQMAATYILHQINVPSTKAVSKIKHRISFIKTSSPVTSDGDINNDTDQMNDDMNDTNDTSLECSYNIENYDEDMVEDGVLPDDCYSDLSKISDSSNNNINNDSVDDRPYDAKRFELPLLHKREQGDFLFYRTTHEVNIHLNESLEMAWRRKAYDKKSSFHRAMLSPEMLPNHVDTVNTFTRVCRKDLVTVLVVVIPKIPIQSQRNDDGTIQIMNPYPVVKCFIRHDVSRNKARNALGLVINQYIDQVLLGNTDVSTIPKPIPNERQHLWLPNPLMTDST